MGSKEAAALLRHEGKDSSRCRVNYMEINKTCHECPPGYFGIQCSNKCPDSYYGRLCRQRCDCKIGHRCDFVKGCSHIPTMNIATIERNEPHPGIVDDHGVGTDVPQIIVYLSIGCIFTIIGIAVMKCMKICCRRRTGLPDTVDATQFRRAPVVRPVESSASTSISSDSMSERGAMGGLAIMADNRQVLRKSANIYQSISTVFENYNIRFSQQDNQRFTHFMFEDVAQSRESNEAKDLRQARGRGCTVENHSLSLSFDDAAILYKRESLMKNTFCSREQHLRFPVSQCVCETERGEATLPKRISEGNINGHELKQYEATLPKRISEGNINGHDLKQYEAALPKRISEGNTNGHELKQYEEDTGVIIGNDNKETYNVYESVQRSEGDSCELTQLRSNYTSLNEEFHRD